MRRRLWSLLLAAVVVAIFAGVSVRPFGAVSQAGATGTASCVVLTAPVPVWAATGSAPTAATTYVQVQCASVDSGTDYVDVTVLDNSDPWQAFHRLVCGSWVVLHRDFSGVLIGHGHGRFDGWLLDVDRDGHCGFCGWCVGGSGGLRPGVHRRHRGGLGVVRVVLALLRYGNGDLGGVVVPVRLVVQQRDDDNDDNDDDDNDDDDNDDDNDDDDHGSANHHDDDDGGWIGQGYLYVGVPRRLVRERSTELARLAVHSGNGVATRAFDPYRVRSHGDLGRLRACV